MSDRAELTVRMPESEMESHAQDNTVKFNSRRSSFLCNNAAVACSQPLAAEVGYKVLKAGGNAADAAVAVAAALNVTEPMMTGLGGDCFVMFYDAKKRTVKGINGSGKSPKGLSLDILQGSKISIENGSTHIPVSNPHAVTVPGSAAAWIDTLQLFGSGKLSLAELLAPAIGLAEDGFPVQDFTARLWSANYEKLKVHKTTHGDCLLMDGKSPRHGDVMTNPDLAHLLKEFSEGGKDAFYHGRIAQDIVDIVQSNGGTLSMEDMADHCSLFPDPISTTYRGIRIWEMPPNGQGIVVLMALNLLETFDLKAMGHNSAAYLHTLIECLRLSFADGLQFVSDPEVNDLPIKNMLSKEYALKRKSLLSQVRSMERCTPGITWTPCGSDTVYFSVVDQDGNACSFINSIYDAFGSGIVPKRCGFALQNRGCNFSLNPAHPNCVAPGKRSYHTIIPGMATNDDTGELYASFGVKGAFMQPTGHVQVLCNMIDFGMDPQRSLDEPRLKLDVDTSRPNDVELDDVMLEEGVAEPVVAALKSMGHAVRDDFRGFARNNFGVGQIIQSRKDRSSRRVLWCGSDSRLDGCVFGY